MSYFIKDTRTLDIWNECLELMNCGIVSEQVTLGMMLLVSFGMLVTLALQLVSSRGIFAFQISQYT